MPFTRRNTSSLAGALISTLLLMGCAYRGDDYPPGWSPLRAGASCTDIVGVYRDRGEYDPAAVTGYQGPPPKILLSKSLFPQTSGTKYDSEDGDVVEISWDGSAYHMRALRGTKTLQSASYSGAQLTCRDGWLTISTRRGLAEEGPVFGYEDASRMLRLAHDGSLIMRASWSTAGLAFMVVPVGGHEVTYSRFERLHSSSNAP